MFTKLIKFKAKQFICVHRYSPLDIWGDYEDKYGRSYWDKVCTKCGKFTQHYYLGKNILEPHHIEHITKIYKQLGLEK